MLCLPQGGVDLVELVLHRLGGRAEGVPDVVDTQEVGDEDIPVPLGQLDLQVGQDPVVDRVQVPIVSVFLLLFFVSQQRQGAQQRERLETSKRDGRGSARAFARHCCVRRTALAPSTGCGDDLPAVAEAIGLRKKRKNVS